MIVRGHRIANSVTQASYRFIKLAPLTLRPTRAPALPNAGAHPFLAAAIGYWPLPRCAQKVRSRFSS